MAIASHANAIDVNPASKHASSSKCNYFVNF